MEKTKECIICREDLTIGKTKVIHKQCKKDCESWDHKFHRECINLWIENCIKSRVFPSCPNCNIGVPIKKIPKNLIEEANKILDGVYEEVVEEVAEEEEEDELPNYIITAHERLNKLQNMNVAVEKLFLGIMIHMNGKHMVTISNLNLKLNINSTLNDLKYALAQKPNIIYNNSSAITWKNIRHNISLYNWVMWKYPKYKITNIHYGIPPYKDSFWHLVSAYDLDASNPSLADIYRDYQSSVGFIMENKDTLEYENESNVRRFEQKHFNELETIYYKSNLRFNGPTGPDDPGHYDRAFVNNNNPFVPETMRAYSYNPNSTEYSLAWLIIHVE